ncbi:aldo/keto reductase [Steroidobacter sp.]|uniref:aldo/keto reductase n=1 Tax=Steroidobacter sp. TaxID=1978227 RepID=UPI001A60DD5E|nr:aldo/keto reductase [Steroidobacter sp.]MBL8270840.1 aldo/keto reductase [Steroidobacter sp.]
MNPGAAADQMPRSRRLGATELRLTEIGFGAAALGSLYEPMSEGTARALIEAAWAAGVRYFDTAPYYGFGQSERRLGDALRTSSRNSFVLSTKVGRLLKPLTTHAGCGRRHGFASEMPFEPVYDYSYDGIMRSFEDSLQRLGLARVDVLLVHDIGHATHGQSNDTQLRLLEMSGYRALDELRRARMVAAIGLGVNEWQVCESVMAWGDFDCFLLAGRYTLLEQGALETFLPKCVARKTGLILGGIYNSGILATGTRGHGPVNYNYEPAPADRLATVRRLERVCDSHGVPLAAAALQFPLAHPQVTSVIPGADSAQQLRATLEHYRVSIPDSLWSDLKAEGLIAADAPVPGSEARLP